MMTSSGQLVAIKAPSNLSEIVNSHFKTQLGLPFEGGIEFEDLNSWIYINVVFNCIINCINQDLLNVKPFT